MINGVIEIVAAVLFAVVFLSSQTNGIWLWVAGFYLICGIGNLAVHTIQMKRKLKAAQKQVEQSAKQAEQAVKVPVKQAEVQEEQSEPVVQELPEA